PKSNPNSRHQIIVPNMGMLVFGTLELKRVHSPSKLPYELYVECLSFRRFSVITARLYSTCGALLKKPHKHVDLAEYHHQAKGHVERRASEQAMSIDELRFPHTHT